MMKLSNVASAAALVGVALSPGLAQADAVAQAILNITSFTASVNTAGALGQVRVVQNGDVKADFGALTASDTQTNTAGNFALNKSVGPDAPGNYNPGSGAGFLPSTIGAGTVDGNYAGASASITGSVLAGGANALVDSTVSITPSGNGSGTSNLNLNSGFVFNLGTASTVTFDFDAEAFLRAYLSAAPGTLGPLSSANASHKWELKITSGNNVVFFWNPDGIVDDGALQNGIGGVAGFDEIADGFDLTDQRGAVFEEDNFVGPSTGAFTATTGSLAAGSYTLSISHTTISDADVTVIPEPEMLSLIGLALFGAAFASRRRLAKK